MDAQRQDSRAEAAVMPVTLSARGRDNLRKSQPSVSARRRGLSLSTVGRHLLTLHSANRGSITTIPFASLSSSGVIPEHRQMWRQNKSFYKAQWVGALEAGPGRRSPHTVNGDLRQHEDPGGMKALRPLPRGRAKARASYVDETLFGSPGGARPTPPDFDPPWVQKAPRSAGGSLEAAPGAIGGSAPPSSRGSTPTPTPRKKNKYRLIGHTPSYCDESLFGPRPGDTHGRDTPWLAKGDTAKLHALCWTPPATPRGSHPPRPRGTPLRAVHPTAPSRTEPRGSADSRGVPVSRLGTPQAPRRGRAHSLTHLNIPKPEQTSWAPPTNGPGGPPPSPPGVTSRSPLITPRARSASISVPAAPRRGRTTQNLKPPWK